MTTPCSFRDDPALPDFDDAAPVAVMGAECAIFSWGGRPVRRLDRSAPLRISPVRTLPGSALRRHYGVRSAGPARWPFLDAGRPHVDFEAALHADRRFGGGARVTAVLRLGPKPLRDRFCRRRARNRHARVGRTERCARPAAAFRKRRLR
ncbi:MAG: DCC1-like thiol-disulfide oxidoreductase family protein [Pseudodonghicola sp.]